MTKDINVEIKADQKNLDDITDHVDQVVMNIDTGNMDLSKVHSP